MASGKAGAVQLSWDEWAKDSVAALQKEAAAVKAAADQALASTSLTSEQKKAIMNREADELAVIAKKERDDQAKAAEESAKAWEQFFKPIDSALDGFINDIISKHETMRAALAKTFDSLIMSGLKWAQSAIQNDAQVVASYLAGNLTIQASDFATNGAASLVGIITQARAAISSFAAVVGAGVAANQAFILGPASVTEGMGAEVVVAGFAGGIGSSDMGSWSLPSDMVAQVHAGEMIVPSAGGWADQVRSAMSGQSGGGGVTHSHSWNVSAIDSQSFMGALRNHASPLSKLVADTMTRDASTRPRY
jgi:hypothetical protein